MEITKEEFIQEVKKKINGILTELSLKYDVDDDFILNIIKEQFL